MFHSQDNISFIEEKKPCLIIVTYNKIPNFEVIYKSIEKNNISMVIIVDNSFENEIATSIESSILSNFKSFFSVIRNIHNFGIAKGINIGLKKAIEMNYNYAFLLDDDAIVHENFFEYEFKMIKFLEKTETKIGGVCPIVCNDLRYLNKKFNFKNEIDLCKRIITSGVLINTNIVKELGGYDETYFMEYADVDFYTRMEKYGYKFFRINQVLVIQDFGRTLSNKSLSTVLGSLFQFSVSYLMIFLNRANDLTKKMSIYPPERELQITRARKRYLKINPYAKNFGDIFYPFYLISISFLKFFAIKDLDYMRIIYEL